MNTYLKDDYTPIYLDQP